ncbi:chemotaxis protein CheW [Ramlibacter tataouinensis]|uniref:Candidate twitching motility protein, chemotaxis protein cheW n=1 Tax=Ramlibacter tataouinensis (strain ATCC BAA-407 / DSM 14655 / LMG 21543 / TTB310) TaxID=365046 RepID=F5XX79_RAMTT|nr:chemotaxis protein CheW [Ramlibacter tataouinensis]AEG93023.1 Candidate twitching motility protein, chemotaxis protein cheW [Ramlibacter tataouinensis TTB310]
MDAAFATLAPLAQLAPSQALAMPANAVLAFTAPLAAADQDERRQGFAVGGLRLMIRYEDGSELAELPASTALPNAPHWFVGTANLHGVLVPVFDLAAYLGVARGGRARPMLLVLGHSDDVTGMVIDGLPRRLRWNAAQVADPGTIPPALAGLVHNAVTVADELWLDLDMPALLDALESALRNH